MAEKVPCRTDLEGTGPGQVLGQTWRDRSWTGPRTDLEGQVLDRPGGTGPGQVLDRPGGDRSWTGPRTDLEGQVLDRS